MGNGIIVLRRQNIWFWNGKKESFVSLSLYDFSPNYIFNYRACKCLVNFLYVIYFGAHYLS